MGARIKRILVYTHNSIGLGHAFRTLALITGMKKWRPDIDFLIISSTSVPQIFFNEGIEVVKLPSVKLDIDSKAHRLRSRYLHDVELEDIFDFRQRVILETFDFFKPDVLIIEHNMTGQMSECIPLLMKKWMRQGGPVEFALVHVCRGIMRWVPLLTIPYENPRHRSESINIGSLYDFMYVLEDREVIDINKAFLGNDPELEKKIRYLGKITNRTYGELAARQETLRRFGLPDKKIVLVSLGRNEQVLGLSKKLLEYFDNEPFRRDHRVVFVVDPYLDKRTAGTLRGFASDEAAIFLNFSPDLVDLINHSELVVSRAGYNTVNEILLTGTKAVLIPESHGSGEQEQRVKCIPNENIIAVTEKDLLSGEAQEAILDLLDSPAPRVSYKFDKYAVGKYILEELDMWKDSDHEC
ncbi:glycosyltransferase family protein [Thermodesulfobacteriota bacterium]